MLKQANVLFVLGGMFCLLGVVARADEGTATITCDNTDVQFAQKSYDSIDKLVKHKVLQPIDLSRAAVTLAETRYCAGQLGREDYCGVVSEHLANLKAIIDRLAVTLPEDVSAIDWYLHTKLYYAHFCGSSKNAKL